MKRTPSIFFCCIWLLLVSATIINGANILFFAQTNGYSHRLAVMPLAEALAARGHHVTFISPHYPKQPNSKIANIVPVQVEEHVRNILDALFDVQVRTSGSQVLLLHNIFDYGFDSCEVLYNAPEFQNWIKTKPSVDLVIADHCMCMECGFGVAYKLGAKYLTFSTISAMPYEYDTFGFLPESSAVPETEVMPPILPLGFFARLGNALMSLRWRLQYLLYSHRMDKLIKEKLQTGNDMPFIGDLVANTSLIFYTGNVINDYPRALPPNYVNIAGLHCKVSNKTLPPSISTFLKDGGDNDGFVYISFGSFVNPSNIPAETIRVFFQVIRSFPRVKFLWKWNNDFPRDAPRNVHFSKWFPQNDVLAQDKIRAFVTQGGRPSTTEAAWNGVPMIGFPILADQDFNVNRLVELGAATKLEIGTVTVEELTEAIRKTVYETTMKTRMDELKNIFRDRQNDPLETAVWWTEYVLRMPNTWHLKPAGHTQNWFVRRQIDVWAFLTVAIILVIFGIISMVTTVIKFLKKSKGEKIKRK